MTKPRISYVPFEDMDEQMQAEMQRAAREGTPRPESNAVRAHVPAAFWAFAKPWEEMFRNGVCDHALKELCRVYISRTVTCEFCGNQRSVKGSQQGLVEGQYDDLLNFETSAALMGLLSVIVYVLAYRFRLSPEETERHIAETEAEARVEDQQLA